MALFKRGRVYWFDFYFRKNRYQGSTHCTNKEAAKTFLAAYRTNLAHSLVGLVTREPLPILSVFLKGKFLDSVRQNAKKPRTLQFYEQKVGQLSKYVPFTMLRLDQIDELAVQDYKDVRLRKKLSPSTINGELRTLRKALRFAWKCKLIDHPSVSTLPGEKNRLFILSGELEKAYLAAAPYPLREVAILMLDLGLRPEEAVSLRKADVTEEAVTIRSGKSTNARRSIPLPHRAHQVCTLCNNLFPSSPWLFPGSKGKHYTRGAIDNLHTQLRTEQNWPAEFVLYSCRHTFATRLAESCNGNLFILKEALGHANTRTCEKYVHPTAKYLGAALRQKEALDRIIRGEVSTDVPTGELVNG